MIIVGIIKVYINYDYNWYFIVYLRVVIIVGLINNDIVIILGLNDQLCQSMINYTVVCLNTL